MQILLRRLVMSADWRWRLSRHTLFWGGWLVYNTVVYGSRAYKLPEGLDYFGIAFVEALMFTPAHMLLSYFILYVLFPHFLYRGRYLWMVPGVIAGMLLSSSFSYLLTIGLVNPFRESVGAPFPYIDYFYGLMAGLRGGTLAGGFAAAIKLMKHWYEKKEENGRLEREKLRAELQFLKSQLHPHFLFNVLNSLYDQTLHHPKLAPGTVLRLSELLRYMLAQSREAAVPLAEEVNFIRNYIALEKDRFNDRLDVMFTVSGRLEQKWISPLILLPFVENAFKHGVSENPGQAWLIIDLEAGAGELTFKVVNGKPGTPGIATGHGVGLDNVSRRLQVLYPGSCQLKYFDEEDSFAVILRLPLEAAPAAPPAPVANHRLRSKSDVP